MDWQQLIQVQIDRHRQLNLLSPRGKNGFGFTEATMKLIMQFASGHFSSQEEEALISYTTNAALSSLYRINQYYQFDQQAENALQMLYRQLLRDIQSEKTDAPDFDLLAEAHYLRLQQWLQDNQPEAKTLYPASQPFIKNPVVCAECSVATQINTLGIDINTLQEPILDIGCGKEHHLVSFLKQEGWEVYGMDREAKPTARIYRCSWLDYTFGAGQWGTIISHLGFTNHFRHQHLKAAGQHLHYATTYIRILQSLKPGGRFYYTPDLPFIEVFLHPQQYLLEKKQVPQTAFFSSCITRL